MYDKYVGLYYSILEFSLYSSEYLKGILLGMQYLGKSIRVAKSVSFYLAGGLGSSCLILIYINSYT